MKIDAKTSLYGLLGNPVGHSLSPLLQNHFLEQEQINGIYLAFPVANEDLGDALAGLHALGVKGCNVTIPHKEAVIPYLIGLSKAAEACGAVNTLVYTEDGYYGDNTDGAGLLAALEVKQQWQPKDKKILMLGAGGAARGVAMAMALAEAEEIILVNRTLARAELLAEQIRQYSTTKVTVLPELSLADSALYQEVDTVVNTTSQGMFPEVETMMPVNIKALTEKHLVVDLVYNPLETKLLRLAREQGTQTTSGLGMFLYQAVLAFAAWHGHRPQIGEAEELLIKQFKRG